MTTKIGLPEILPHLVDGTLLRLNLGATLRFAAAAVGQRRVEKFSPGGSPTGSEILAWV